MLKGIDTLSETFLADLNRIQERQVRVQNQISSGLSVQRASDAPERVADIFRLKSLIQHNEQIDSNLTSITAEVNTGEAAVRQAVQLLERANTLGTQTSGNSSDVNRPLIAIEVKQLHEQLVSLTRASAQGRFVFSGDLDQSLLYTPDWTQPGGVAQLKDSLGVPVVVSNTRLVEDNMGARFSISKSAGEIFDTRNPDGTPATDNAFQVVYELGKALEANDPNQVEATMPKLKAALDHLNIQLSFFGNAQNRVKAAVNATKNQHIELAKQLSDRQDTDLASALVELNMVGVQQQAALEAHARLPKANLFDYLG